MVGSFDPSSFHERAVRTPSHEGVTAMRTVLVEELEDHGVAVTVDDAGNVVAARGDGHPHLLLNTHLDTVPPPLPVTVDGDRVRGRGACDAKGPLAALVAAFLDVDPAGGRITLAVTPDEETDSTGAAALADRLDPDACIVGEPTDLDVCNAARGRAEVTISLAGEHAHAAEPGSGANAVAAVEQALAAVRTFDQNRGPGEHGSLGAPSLVPTIVRGGTAANQVPARCQLTVDRRSVPPETAATFRDALSEHVREQVPAAVDVTVTLAERDTPFLEAFETPPDDPLVRALADASGGTVRPFGAATEASYFAELAPTVVFGPGMLTDEDGPVAHSNREYIRRSALTEAATALGTAVGSFVE